MSLWYHRVLVILVCATFVVGGNALADGSGFEMSDAAAQPNPYDRSVAPSGAEWFPFSVKPPYGVDRGSDKPFMVYIGAANIEARPGTAPPQIPAELKIAEPMGSRPAYYIVHFEGRIQSEWKQKVLDAGAVSTENYLSNNALIFHLSPAAFASVSAVPEVDWIGYYEPAYKLDPMIGALRLSEEAISAPTTLLVVLYGGVDPGPVQAELTAMGLRTLDDIQSIRTEKHVPQGTTPWILRVEGSRSQAPEIALLDDVQYVSEAATVKHHDAYSAGGILQSGDNAPWGSLGALDPPLSDPVYFPMWARGLQGQHQMIGLADGGIDWGGSGELFALPVNPLDTSPTYDLKVPKASLRDGSANPCDAVGGHGTGVAGSCCQDFSDNSTTEFREADQPGRGEWGDGPAHEAQIVVGTLNYSGYDPSTQRLQWLDLAGFGASTMASAVHWCTGATFSYDVQSWMADSVVYTSEEMLIVSSAGNDASACPAFNTSVDCQTQSWAKNPLDVGASDDGSRWNLMDTLSFDSSRGPDWANPPGGGANDFIFPDVVATGDDSINGSGTLTASADGTCGNADTGIQGFGGTSGSAPTMAGAGALVHQYYEEGNQVGITDASAALIKATLINGADALDGTGVCNGSGSNVKRPGGDQGWGRPNLSNVLSFSTGTPTAFIMNATDVRNADGFSASGQFDEITLDITNTDQPLRITLAWTDAPSTIGSGRPYVVNDLDLELEKGGILYRGNNFNTATGLSTTATTATDSANVVENIFLDPSQVAALGTGAAKARVRMANAPSGGSQGYALVAVGGLNPPTSVRFDKNEYICSDTVTVTATDGTPAASATVTSPSDSESVTLSGIGNDQYEGTVSLALGDTTPDNGVLGISDGETIDVVYETIYTDSATVRCSANVLTGSVLMAGGCDVWDPNDPTANTGEKYAPYMDSGEYVTVTYNVFNSEAIDLVNTTLQLVDGAASGCLSILGDNPVSVGTIPADSIAGASWSVEVLPCGSLTSVLLDLVVNTDSFPLPSLITDVATLVNADDVIEEHGVCFDHTTGDMTSLDWSSQSFVAADIGWTQTSSASCGSEVRTDGDCADSSLGMYKQGACGSNTLPANSAGTIVPPAPISLVNSDNGSSGEPWRYAAKRFSFFGASSVPESDEVFFGVFFDDAFDSATQITDGAEPWVKNGDGTGWIWSLAFLPGSNFFDCCGDTPSSWNWDAAETGTPGADAFCGDPGTAPDNQSSICFGNATTGVQEAGEIGPAGSVYLNFAVTALEEQLLGNGDGGVCSVTGVACDSAADCSGGGGLCVDTDGWGIDNSELVWEEFFADVDLGDCSGGQCGQVSFDLSVYRENCLSETAIVSVIDDSVVGNSVVVGVGSATAGDAESVTLTRQGTSSLYTGQLELATNRGLAPGDGTLFVRPQDSLTATYDDADDGAGSPCTSVASAFTDYPSGDISIASRPFYFDNGDDDGYPDTNESSSFELEIRNDTESALTNTVVSIATASPNIVCIVDDTSSFGTIAAGGAANNPASDRFMFQVDSGYECTNATSPDSAVFKVFVTADGFCGSNSNLETSFLLDVDVAAAAAATTAPDSAAAEQPEAAPAERGPSFFPPGSILQGRPSSAQRRDVATTKVSHSRPAAPAAPAQSTATTRPEPKPSDFSYTESTCGNSQYDDGTAENAEWFGGGQAGDPGCILGQIWDPTDFGLTDPYEIQDVCFDNSIDFGGLWPNHWYIHPDSGGLPDEGTILADGIVSTGDGNGEISFNFGGTPIQMGAGEKFWVIVRGDTSCCDGEDFNLEVDQTTPSTQSFRTSNSCGGVADLTNLSGGEYVIHTTLAVGLDFVCDTTDNSLLPPSCAVPVSGTPGSEMVLGTDGTLVDLTFEDVGLYAYDVYVSTGPETITATPFDVDAPDGKLDCDVTTADIGAARTITGYNVEAGIATPSDIYFILMGTHTAFQTSSLGENSIEGERHSTSDCLP